MSFDPDLADEMRKALKKRAGFEEKKTFGGYCWRLNDGNFDSPCAPLPVCFGVRQVRQLALASFCRSSTGQPIRSCSRHSAALPPSYSALPVRPQRNRDPFSEGISEAH
jgi:hypothetical protein